MAVIRSRRRSVTIVEIVMSIVILSVAIPPLMNAFAESAVQSIHPSLAAVAGFLATDRMEEIIARRYRATDGYSAVTTGNFPDETPVSGFSKFNRSVTISNVTAALQPAGSDQGYKRVRVTVSWNGGADAVMVERVFADF
ncbi:MAG: hypothetical protein KF841_07765 [Phycisphaerae bacterium]|nr:hypothetical protein [Phycisphaerae bacterium]